MSVCVDGLETKQLVTSKARKVFPDFEKFAVEYIFRKICEIVDRQKSDKIYFKKIEIVGKTRQNAENQ